MSMPEIRRLVDEIYSAFASWHPITTKASDIQGRDEQFYLEMFSGHWENAGAIRLLSALDCFMFIDDKYLTYYIPGMMLATLRHGWHEGDWDETYTFVQTFLTIGIGIFEIGGKVMSDRQKAVVCSWLDHVDLKAGDDLGGLVDSARSAMNGNQS